MNTMRMIAAAGLSWCMAVALAAGAQKGGNGFSDGNGGDRISRPGRVGVNGMGTYVPGQQPSAKPQERSRSGVGKSDALGASPKSPGSKADMGPFNGPENGQGKKPGNQGGNQGNQGGNQGNQGMGQGNQGGDGNGQELGGGKGGGGNGHGGPQGKNGFGGPKGKNGFGGAQGKNGAGAKGGGGGNRGGKGGNGGGGGRGARGR